MFGALDFSVIPASLPYVWRGLLFSLQLTAIAMSLGIVFGTLLALARLSGMKLVSGAASAYVDLMRSIPLVMVILWFFLIIPMITPMGMGKSAVITFAAFEAAFYCEIMRAGIQSIPKGQVAAGYALGMNYWQTMGTVVLPQAFRNMLPLLLTQTIVLFQDTSLVYAIGAWDLLKGSETAGKNYNRPVEMYLFVAVIYFTICFSLSRLVKQLQQRFAVIR
jgi:glutamate/aspartate transport system permease protein